MKAAGSNMDNNRKLLTVRDILIIVSILGLALGAYLFLRASDEASCAVITADGTELDRIQLYPDGQYDYPQIPGMVFTVRDGAVSVTESGCHDRVCVRTGAVSRRGEAVICVPNRVTVTIEGGGSEGGGNDLDVVLR